MFQVFRGDGGGGDQKWQKMTHNYQFQSVTFFNWDSLHAKLNSHYKAWSFKKKEKVKDIGQMYS